MATSYSDILLTDNGDIDLSTNSEIAFLGAVFFIFD